MMYEVALTFSIVTYVLVSFAFVRSRAFSAFHPLTFYIVFHGFLFVLRPIFAYLQDFDLVYRLFQFTPSMADKVTVIVAANLGFVAFALTCWSAGNQAMVFRNDGVVNAERKRIGSLFPWVFALCAPAGIYALATTWNSIVDTGFAYSEFVRDAETGISISGGMSGYLVESPLLLATCSVILVWLFRFRLLAFVPLIAFILFKAGSGGRGPFIAALGAAGLLYLYEKRRRMPTTLVMVALPAIALLFSTVGADRGASIRQLFGSDMSHDITERYRTEQRALEGMDFANMEYFEFIVFVVPQRSGTYGYFNDVLQIATEPIPRAWWHHKPAGPPFARIRWWDYGRPITMSFSLPGEGWYSLGWAGVLLWCSLCGWMLGKLYSRFVEGPQSSFQTIAYMVLLSMLILSFRDGQLITVIRQGLFYMAPIGLWWALARLNGIPSVSIVRARIRRRLPSARNESRSRDPSAPDLPAAVLRRRLALAKQTQSVADPANQRKT